MKQSRLALIALAVAVPALLAGCERTPEPQARFVSVAEIKGLDPVDSGSVYASGAMSQVYDGLYEYEYLKRPLELRPALADGDPDVSEDGLTYTFHLKQGIVFQDNPCFADGKGREVTAQDFVYCWKRLMCVPSSTGAWLLEGRIDGLDDWATRAGDKLSTLFDTINEYYPYEHPEMASMRDEDVPGLLALDDHTLQVKLSEPFPQFMWTLAMIYTAVYPHEALEYYGMEMRTHPVGTGPYTIDEYWPFSLKLRFKRNPTYRVDLYPTEGAPGDAERGLLADAGKQLPFLDDFELVVVTNSSPRWLQFMEGSIERVETEKDIWEEAMNAEGKLRKDVADKGVTVHVESKADIAYTAFNMEDPVIGLPAGERGRKLRHAMSLAYDRAGWIKVMRNGFWATPAYGPIPPTVAGFVDVKTPYGDRDLERARKLLEEAGYPEGRGLEPLHYEMSGSSPVNRNGSEILKTSMADIGIKIVLNANTWDQFEVKVKKKNAQMFGMAWLADYPDAQNFLQLFYGPAGSPGPNNSNYKNPEYDRLYDRMKLMQPGPARDEVIKQMLVILNEDCPWSYTDYRVQYCYINPWLENFKYNYTVHWPIKYYRVDPAKKAAGMKKRRGGQ